MSLLDDKRLSSYIEEVQAKWCIPGLSVTIVDIDQDLSETKPFGMAGIDKSVQPDSIFPIASNSKLFLVLALAILVEEGKLRWNSRLCDLVPDLDLRDKHAQDTLTVEDVLSHNSGYLRHLEAEFNRCSKISDAFTVVNSLDLFRQPREGYQYSNIFYSLLADFVAITSGQSFTTFVKKRILEPLKMTSTSFGKPQEFERLVKPYASIPELGQSQQIGLTFQDLPEENIAGPPGGIMSTGPDMARLYSYLLRLHSGQLSSRDDPNTIQRESIIEVLRSRVLASEQIGAQPARAGEQLFPEFSPSTYALGQFRCHYRGIDISSHNGMAPGGGCLILWTPGRNFAVIILTNVLASAYHAACVIALRAMDIQYGLADIPWISRFSELLLCQNNGVAEPPKSDGSASAVAKGDQRMYQHAGVGILHVLDPDTNAGPGSTPVVLRVLEWLKCREVFGNVCSQPPDLVAFFENAPLFCGFAALYHVTGSTYWGIKHDLYETENDSGTTKVVDVPHTVTWHSGGGRVRCDILDATDSLIWFEDYVQPSDTAKNIGQLYFTRV